MNVESFHCADAPRETTFCKQRGGDYGYAIMTKWHTCKLGDLLQIKHGFAFLGEYFGRSGTHVVLTPGNFHEEGGFKEKIDKAKWYKGPIPNDYILREGDLIVAMTEQAEGLLGSSAIIPRSGFYLHNQRLGLVQIRDRKLADQRFIYYLFNSKPVRQQIRASASGTKIRHTAPSRIADVKVSVPPLPVQRRIAGILSAYDELIENSQRRIRILEEMARALYREWFVHFRFPGHENHPLTSSSLGDIPQGWEVKKLGDVVILNYGKALKKENRCNGVYPVYGSSGIVGMHDTSLVKGPGIIVGRKGNVGSIFWCDDDFFVIDTAYFVTSYLPLRYLFYVLPTMNFINSDAAVPGLSRNQAYTLEILVPPAALLKKFCELAGTFESQASTLQRQIQNLRLTRDYLLPKLLAGDVKLKEN
ncbi:MAG: restriction endonuclease subunit S [Pelodictyon phaeoclathratiforme]